jgi:hypothetical protein
MEIALTLISSTGRDSDMWVIDDREMISEGRNRTGFMRDYRTFPHGDETFCKGYPMPHDRHTLSVHHLLDFIETSPATADDEGSFEIDQLDVYAYTWHAPQGEAIYPSDPAVIPNSGHTIKRTIRVIGGNVLLRTEKRPNTVFIGGYSSAAGPSSTYTEDVVVRSCGMRKEDNWWPNGHPPADEIIRYPDD